MTRVAALTSLLANPRHVVTTGTGATFVGQHCWQLVETAVVRTHVWIIQRHLSITHTDFVWHVGCGHRPQAETFTTLQISFTHSQLMQDRQKDTQHYRYHSHTHNHIGWRGVKHQLTYLHTLTAHEEQIETYTAHAEQTETYTLQIIPLVPMGRRWL